MKIIDKAETITGTVEKNFEVDNSGWYAISVSARVKSEKQRGAEATDDEDLRIEIDGQKFPKLDNSERYLDSPTAFSGGQQKSTLKIVYFIIYLKGGKHNLSFIADEGAQIEKVEIDILSIFPEISLDLNLKAEERDRSPWITFSFVNAGISSFTVKATTNWRFRDGDDIKIIVDGKIKKNNFSVFYRNWIFSSSVLKKIFGKETDEKTFEENLPIANLHYVEIWADQTPTLEHIGFKLLTGENDKEDSDENKTDELSVRPYKPGPNGEDYNRFDTEIKSVVDDWNKEFMAQKYPPTEPLDPNLVKAMIYVESKLGYGLSSTGYPAYPDIMQIADSRNPAIHTLNNDGWIDPSTDKEAKEYEWSENGISVLEYKEAKVDSSKESVRWGTRWLYHKAQLVSKDGNREWKNWEQTVADYNGGGDPDYQKKVYKIYEEGTDSEGNKLWLSLVILFFCLATIAGALLYQNEANKFYAYRERIENGRDRDFNFYIRTLDGLRWKKFLLAEYRIGRPYDTFYNEEIFANFWTPINKGEKLLAVSGKNISDRQTVAMIAFKKGEFKLIPKTDKFGITEKTFQAEYIEIENLDLDPEEEIVEDHFVYYDGIDDQVWKRYYDFDRESGVYKFIKETKKSISGS